MFYYLSRCGRWQVIKGLGQPPKRQCKTQQQYVNMALHQVIGPNIARVGIEITDYLKTFKQGIVDGAMKVQYGIALLGLLS